MKQLIGTLRAQLAAGTPGKWVVACESGEWFVTDENYIDDIDLSEHVDLLVTLRNNAEALLDYIEKLEAVVEAADGVRTSVDSSDRRLCEWRLWSALAALGTSNNRDEVTALREKV